MLHDDIYNKKLNLEDKKSIPIDDIVKMYQDGQIPGKTISDTKAMSDIKALTYNTQCSGSIDIAFNNTSSLLGTVGVVQLGKVWAQRFLSNFRCLDMVEFNVKKEGTSNYNFHIEIRKDSVGLPMGVPLANDAGLVYRTPVISYTELPTSWAFRMFNVGTIINSGEYYWICFVPVSFFDSIIYRDSPQDDVLGLQDGTNIADKRSAVYKDGAWSDSSTFAFAAYKLSSFLTPSNAQVFNMCWGPGLGAQCSMPPERPVVTIGTTVTIKADIANNGGTGKIRAVFKIDGGAISDQNTASLGTYPGGGFWSPITTYLMSSSSITLAVEGYGWDGSAWVLSQTQTATISATTPTCTGISIDANTVVANVGDPITLTAYGVTPTTQPFNVAFLDRSNNVLGTCTTTNGMCSSQWDTTGLAPGQYYVRAVVTGQCYSTELAIGLSLPIRQWSIDITVLDNVTSSPIPTANVTIGVRTLQTDANGHILFTGVDEGTINVSITKTGYNNSPTNPESLYNNITRTYRMVPVSQNPGSLRFMTSPPGISGAEVHFIGDSPTLKGVTDVNGIFTVASLTAGRVVNYEVRKTTYNIATGSATVVGNTTTDVLVTMTPISTTGSVCIHSNPSGASIKIDTVAQAGKSTALSGGGCIAENTISNLTAGSHNYELALIGYQNRTGTFSITVGGTTDHNAGVLTPLSTLGTLNMASNPSGARIYIKVGGTYQDTERVTGTLGTPTVITTLTAGTYEYKLILTGYDDYLNTFAITAGQITDVYAILTLVSPTTGTLSISSFPQGAAIYIIPEGGAWQDVTRVTGPEGAPTLVTGLSPGNYSYKLTYPIYEDKIGPFVATAGETTGPIHVDLTPVSPTTGTLSISSSPEGAKIYIMAEGGTWQDISRITGPELDPALITGLIPGNYLYKLTLAGYSDNTSIFTITAEQITGPIHVNLIQVQQAGGGMIVLAAVAILAAAMFMAKKSHSSPSHSTPGHKSVEELR